MGSDSECVIHCLGRTFDLYPTTYRDERSHTTHIDVR